MKKIVFLTLKDSRFGFSLAGAIQYEITADQVVPLIRSLMNDKETGIVVVDERLTKGIRTETLKDMEKKWYGVLLTLPDPDTGAADSRSQLDKLVKAAIGYHVRLS